jgi:hypothetical protein
MNTFIYENTYGDYEGSYNVKHFFETIGTLDDIIVLFHEKALEHFNAFYKEYWKSPQEFINHRKKSDSGFGSQESFNPLQPSIQFDHDIKINLIDALEMNLEKDFKTLQQFLKDEIIVI